MYNRNKVGNHSVHPLLTVFPIAFYTASLAGFICYQGYHEIFWFRLAVSANTSGVVMALAGAVAGLIDWLYVRGEKEERNSGLLSILFNTAALVLFSLNLYFTVSQWNLMRPVADFSVLLTTTGLLCTLVAGFYGLKWFYRSAKIRPEHEGWELGIGVNA